MSKGVKTKLHLKWNMDKNKYYLYLDGQKVCRLDEAQWMLIAMHLGDKQIEGIQGPMGPAGMRGKDGKDCNCKCIKEETNG